MSTFRHPVGSQPPSVYWRRRLVVGAGLAVVIVVILLIIFVPKGGDTPTKQQSGTPTPSATATATAAACDPDDLKVTALLDQSGYSSGEMPQMSFKVTNKGATACVLDGGTDKQDFLITSGTEDEKYWESTDCQTDSTPYQVTIEAGGDVSSNTPLEWDRTRSSTTTCDTTRDQVPTGATYQLTVTVDGVSSKPVNIVLVS
ncbi:MAG: hypothetical protein QM635_04650 [Microbacteriaceae bacterium]